MIMLGIFLILLILLDLVALYWGHDSRDDINSAEWVRRQEWLQVHLIHKG